MPIDPNIALQVRNAQIESPLAKFAQAQQLQAGAAQNRLAEIQLQQAQTAADEDAIVRDAYRTSGGDTNALLATLAKAGAAKPYQAVQKAVLEAAEKKAATQSHEATTRKVNAEIDEKMLGRLSATMASMLSNPSDDNLRASLGAFPSPEAQRHLETLLAVQDPEIRRQLILGHAMQTEPGRKVVELTLPNFKDAGGRLVNVNPHAYGPGAQPIEKTETIGDAEAKRHNRETEATARGQLGVAQRREAREAASAAQGVTYQTDADGNLVAVPSRVAPGTAAITPIGVLGPDGKPMQGKGAAATEDERKAAGWLQQASAAYSDLLRVMGQNPGARTPGLVESIIPTDLAKNLVRGADRQQFVNASSSLSEALLRAATGAGINAYEAKQKVDEITPVYGDDEKTIKQKLDRIPGYLESLKLRAGRAAPKGWTMPTAPAPGAGGAPGGGAPAAPFDASAIDAELARRAGGR